MTALPPGKTVISDEQREGLPPSKDKPEKRQNNATTGASAAGVRALTARLAAFYFKVPIKAFFRTRVEYVRYISI